MDLLPLSFFLTNCDLFFQFSNVIFHDNGLFVYLFTSNPRVQVMSKPQEERHTWKQNTKENKDQNRPVTHLPEINGFFEWRELNKAGNLLSHHKMLWATFANNEGSRSLLKSWPFEILSCLSLIHFLLWCSFCKLLGTAIATTLFIRAEQVVVFAFLMCLDVSWSHFRRRSWNSMTIFCYLSVILTLYPFFLFSRNECCTGNNCYLIQALLSVREPQPVRWARRSARGAVV